MITRWYQFIASRIVYMAVFIFWFMKVGDVESREQSSVGRL